MRIAFVGSIPDKSGGIGVYIEACLRELQRANHALFFFYEDPLPPGWEPMSVPTGVGRACVSELGKSIALEKLRKWKPDLIFTQGSVETSLEADLLSLAPCVFFAHGYSGTCISGTKTFKQMMPRPCTRRFGAGCFIHYYPHHCGGWNPLRMLSDYSAQRSRLDRFTQFKKIVTASDYMRREFLTHGIPESQVVSIPLFVSPIEDIKLRERALEDRRVRDYHQILFAGRMDILKGTKQFFNAIPELCERLAGKIRVVFAGEGPEREICEQETPALSARYPNLDIQFLGWIPRSDLESHFAQSDIVVLPSVWPEPFGLVGIEAGKWGTPAVAFNVGGIPEWLTHGVNGLLARGTPPTAHGLANAIFEALSDPEKMQSLRNGAIARADEFSPGRHIDRLINLFLGLKRRRPEIRSAAIL